MDESSVLVMMMDAPPDRSLGVAALVQLYGEPQALGSDIAHICPEFLCSGSRKPVATAFGTSRA